MRPARPKQVRWILAAAGALAAAAMLPVLANGFTHWDDAQTIHANWRITPPSWQGLWAHWTTQHMSLYVPLTYTAWAVVSVLSHVATGEAHPAFFHAASLLLHALAAAAVARLVMMLLPAQPATPRGKNEPARPDRAVLIAALAGAAVFAVHPLQVETVAWASGLKDVLMGLMSVLCLIQVLRADEHWSDSRRRRRALTMAAVLLILAMLAKPTAVIVPLMTVPLLWLRRAPWRRIAAIAVPGLVLALPFVVIGRIVQPAHLAVDGGPLWARPLIAADALAFYALKLIWPIHLVPDYGRNPRAVLDAGAHLWTWIVPAALALAAWLARQRWPMIAAGAAAAVVPIVPVSGLVTFEFQQYSTAADHYVYLALAGIGIAIAGAVHTLLSRGRLHPAAIAVAGAVLLIALIVLDWRQARHWRDTRTLFTHTLTVNPRSSAALNGLAFLAVEAHRPAEARTLALRAIEANPRSVNAHVHLGNAASLAGDLAASEAAYRAALNIAPHDPVALANLGGLLAHRGAHEEAQAMLRHAIEVDPDLADARLNLGTLLAVQGRWPDAEQHLRAAVRLNPRDPRALTNLAIVLRHLGREDEARALLSRALELDPTFAPARNALSSP